MYSLLVVNNLFSIQKFMVPVTKCVEKKTKKKDPVNTVTPSVTKAYNSPMTYVDTKPYVCSS